MERSIRNTESIMIEESESECECAAPETTMLSFDSSWTKSEKSSEEDWRERYITLLDDIDHMLDALLNVINDL